MSNAGQPARKRSPTLSISGQTVSISVIAILNEFHCTDTIYKRNINRKKKR